MSVLTVFDVCTLGLQKSDAIILLWTTTASTLWPSPTSSIRPSSSWLKTIKHSKKSDWHFMKSTGGYRGSIGIYRNSSQGSSRSTSRDSSSFSRIKIWRGGRPSFPEVPYSWPNNSWTKMMRLLSSRLPSKKRTKSQPATLEKMHKGINNGLRHWNKRAEGWSNTKRQSVSSKKGLPGCRSNLKNLKEYRRPNRIRYLNSIKSRRTSWW